MTHFYEKNIVEIKNEYTLFLTNIMTPLMYEGIKRIYDKSIETNKKFVEAMKNNPNIEIPGILKIFQTFLKGIKNINNNNIEIETERIRERSKCSDWFDDLIKAVIKSYIVLLTYNASGKTCKLVEEKFHSTIDTKIFIHKCYIECARIFYNYPELFWHKYVTIEIKRNQREAYELIKVSIVEAIRKMLPMKLILEEYLKNDYIKEDDEISESMSDSRYRNIKKLVQKDLSTNTNKILESDDDLSNQIDDISKSIKEINENENVSLNKLFENPNQNIEQNQLQNQLQNPNQNNEQNEIRDNKEMEINNLVNIQSQLQNNENEQNSVFGKITKKGLLNTEQVNRLNQPGYIKSPIPIRKNKKTILKEMIESLKQNNNNEKIDDNEININFVRPSIKSDKNINNTK